MIKSDKLVEATILALQGKLELKENKHRKVEARNLTAKQKNMIKQFVKDENAGKDVQWYKLITELEKVNDYETLNQDARRFKEDCELECVDENKAVKTESIDVNVNDTTTVSVEGNETIVDTEDATVIVNKKEDEFIPETSDDLPAEMPETTVDATVAPDTDTVEVPVDDTVMPEDITDETIDNELPADETTEIEESKKVESVEIEVSDDGKEVEVTTDNGEEVEVKDETPDNNEEENEDTETEVPADDEPSIDEMIEESKVTDYIDEDDLDKAVKNAIKDCKNYEAVEDMLLKVSTKGYTDFDTTYKVIKGDDNKFYAYKINDNNEKIGDEIYLFENKKVESAVRDGAEKIARDEYQKGRNYSIEGNDECLLATNKLADYIADVAEEMGDDYSEWLGEEDIKYLIDTVAVSSIYNDFKNQLEELIKDHVIDRVDYIRKDDPASKYYTAEEDDNLEEGKQAEKNKEDILKNKKARFIKTTENTRSKRVQEMKANRKSNALEKLQRNVEQHKKVMEAKKLQERKYSESTWYEYEVEGVKYNFLCRTWETSQSWGHEVELKEGYRTIATTRCRYYNRTWEMFTFQSCMIKAIDEAIKSGADEAKMNELRSQVEKGKGLQESKKVEAKNDLGINEGVPKKEEPVPNTATKIEEKFSSKSFSRALTEFYSMRMKTVESVNVNRVAKTLKGLKIEATLMSKSGKAKQTVCLEMKKIQTGKSFDKYEMINTVGLIKENKASDTKITMTTFTNKHNVIECRYILCK